MGMVESKTNPSLWYKWKDGKLWLVAVVYVDDIVYAGSKEARHWFKEEVQKRFKITDLGKLRKHVGVWYEKKKDEKGSYY